MKMALRHIRHLKKMEILKEDFIDGNQVLVQQEKIQEDFLLMKILENVLN
jgi:hypothetical protein